jgi:prepilin-type N-terminal cleavage/methylation domain-containing protein
MCKQIFPTSSPRRHLRAFTLVEILAVVVIIGIASAIIVPQMGTRDDLRVSASARTLIADLVYAQSLAISNGSFVYIKFDTANNKYTLLSAANSSADTALSHPITQTTYLQQFGSSTKDWQGVSIESATFTGISSGYSSMYTLAFDEIGSPYVFRYTDNTRDEMSSGSIVMKAGDQTKTVTVSAATGEITVN